MDKPNQTCVIIVCITSAMKEMATSVIFTLSTIAAADILMIFYIFARK